MKILHTVDSLYPESGGPAKSVPGLAGATAKAGAEVCLWAADMPADYQAPEGVQLVNGALDTALEQVGSPDLIHDHGLWLPINHQVANLASRSKIPRIVSPRGMLEPWALNHKKWKKRLAWWLYQRRDLHCASALHATADSEAAQFRKLGLNQLISVVPNGVDIPMVTGSESGNTDSQKTALFLSRIHPKKGLAMLVKAWKKINPEGWEMRVVGPDEGGHRDEIMAMVDAAGLSASWEFEDTLEGEDKWRAFESASLFILPTFSENFGIVVAEALAVGVPVITTTGAPWEGLVENDCGWWVEPQVADIARALSLATSMQSTQLCKMGADGKQWVEREFAWPSIGERMLKGYEEILSRK